MKKLLIFFSLTLAFALPLGTTAFATDPFKEVCKKSGTANSEVCSNDSRQDGTNPISGRNGVITRVVNVVASIAGALAVIIIIVAGFQYVMAGGDSNKITNARNAIIFALVGLIFIVVARSTIVFVINRL